MFITILGFLIIAISIFLLLAYQVFVYLEKEVIFQPSRQHIWQPSNGVTSMYFPDSSSYRRLHAWFLPSHQNKPIILFCHGNNGNISYRRYAVKLCESLNFGLFIFDYQGYGYSNGRPTLDGIKKDGELAYQQLLKLGYSGKDIIIWGESLGSGVAIHLASKYSCRQLLLMAAYSDLSRVILNSGRFIAKLAYPFLRNRDVNNLSNIRKVSCPVFIAHSTDDEIIPHHQAKELYEAINHDWKILVDLQGKHSSPRLKRDFFEKLLRFSWLPVDDSRKYYEIVKKIEKDIL